MQQRFVSDVSHELRTPLTTIRMAADVLHESRDGLRPQAARSAELLHAQLDRFEALLTDLLEISRFDAGAAVLDAEPTDLRALVDARSSRRRRRSPSSRARRSRCAARTRAATADVDPRRVERILRNLSSTRSSTARAGRRDHRGGRPTRSPSACATTASA